MPSYRRFLTATTLTAALLAATALAPARAAPNAQPDAMLQLLQDKGLLAGVQADGSALVRQVRVAASDMVVSALNFLGVPYRLGGNSGDEGFDCSGFTRHIFQLGLGRLLPRRAEQQASDSGLQPVQREQLEPGDLVFFNTMRRAFSHVGIYIGDGKFIHAPRSGAEVRIEDMRQSYWSKRYNGARRAELQAAAPATRDAAAPTLLP
ncbi:MAG: C40 family peptidase [Rubrivivax sp.]|nr:C40 family peptidase [Rubrivivax sp.]MDP3085518.1 C40 family peptidase [Rubrivivax sp.]